MPASDNEPAATVDNQSYYDKFADSYEHRRHGGYHLLVDELESDLVIPFARGKDALEVGCGTGLILQRIAAVARSAKGIDLSEGMLAHARGRGLDVQQASATSLPFSDESFDVTYSFKVLAHVPELETALAEMGRVTRRGGRVFIELYNKHSLRYLIRRLRGGESIGHGLDDNQVFFRFHSPKEMERALPPTLRLERVHGVRVFTTIPALVSAPLIGGALKRAEWMARSSALARFGGFLVMECARV
jgi:ubiquinone/menaquinone biosynthesis C-methylase UbiE